MLTLTWMESRGELSTGIIWPMAGSMALMWLTRRKKPESRNPNTITMRKRRCISRAMASTNHARSSIVS